MEQPQLKQSKAKPSPTPPPPPKPLHRSNADEEDEKVEQLDECSSLYRVMKDCVFRTNRNWKECQPEVQALKECFAKRKMMDKANRRK